MSETQLQPQPQNKSNKILINKIITFVCCLIIALSISDAISRNQWIQALPTIVITSLLFPGVMEWDFKKANKYQKAILICITLLNLMLIGYLIFRK
jgi:hypothetical protein